MVKQTKKIKANSSKSTTTVAICKGGRERPNDPHSPG